MSKNGFRQRITPLLSGRWQVPVALAAALVASVAFYRVLPRNSVPNVGSLLADITALEEAGAVTDAADALGNLLEMQPPLPPAQRAALHDRLAELIFQQEQKRSVPELPNVRLLLEHHDAADELGHRQHAHRHFRLAKATEWLGNTARAIPAYRNALALDPSVEDLRAARQGLVQLLRNQPESAPERQRLLETLLADEGVSAGYLWWALQQSLEIALDENDTVRARLLLGKHGNRLKSSDLKGYWDYLWAWIMVHEGRTEEAEPLVQWIEQWLGERSVTDRELEGFGHLPAMNRWLLGQIHLADHRPQEALATFEEALALTPPGDLFVAAAAGQARALAELERHTAAQQAFRQALTRLAAMPSEAQQGTPRLRKSLLTLYDLLRAKQEYDHAAEYLALACELTPPEQSAERLALLEKLGETSEQAARATADPASRREYFGQAGRYREHGADLCEADETRYSALLWSAAQGYDEAGRIADVRRVLQRFLTGRSKDPRLPRAFLQLGQAYEADGQFEYALDWYARLDDRYPGLEEAFRAQLLSAGCLLALGRAAEAERVLSELLEDDLITPQAVVFHDALLELCDLLYQQGRFADAISRLEDFAAFYPGDPERFRSRFLLADAYRRSGYALRDSSSPQGDAAELRATSRTRFRRAAELFGGLLQDLSAAPEPDEALKLYDQLSLFYRADCLFELNEADTLQEALEIYQRAAARYEQEPPALTAQVQIASIHLRNGRLTEAARAVERARWLLRNIPDSAFADYSDDAGREHWEQYLAAISSSELFQNVFAGGP